MEIDELLANAGAVALAALGNGTMTIEGRSIGVIRATLQSSELIEEAAEAVASDLTVSTLPQDIDQDDVGKIATVQGAEYRIAEIRDTGALSIVKLSGMGNQ